MNIKVKVIKCNRITHKGCLGMEGEITSKQTFNNRIFYEVTASNFGPLMTGEHGKKKVYAWRPNNRADFLREELEKIT